MVNTWRVWTLFLGLIGPLACAGCRTGGPAHLPTEAERVEMLSLMLPIAIEIQPFTKIKSFNDDEIPDGILAVVRPLDRFGDPVKAVGLFYFELWTFQASSGERKGERLAYWDRTIGTMEEVGLYWDRSQMYEFQLAWTGGAEGIRPGKKFVLKVTYRTPWDETIEDERVLDFHLAADTFGSASAE